MSRPIIALRGVRTHNLKDLDLDLPRDALTVVAGVSGSGKSSLVLDTLGQESRRRFLGTLGRSAGTPEIQRPDMDRIDGLPPAVLAGFSTRAPGARTTLGTITEVEHALRSLFARVGTAHCPDCGTPVVAWVREEIADRIAALGVDTRVLLLAPAGKGPVAFADSVRRGFVRVRIAGGPVVRVDEVEEGAVRPRDAIEIVVDRIVVRPAAMERIHASVEQALEHGGGVMRVATVSDDDARELTFADRPYCAGCDTTWPRLSVALFSPSSPRGACPSCAGRGDREVLDPARLLPYRLRLGRVGAHLSRALSATERTSVERAVTRRMKAAGLDPRDRVGDLPEGDREALLEGKGRAVGIRARVEASKRRTARYARRTRCPDCGGARLGPYARGVTVAGRTLPDLLDETVTDLIEWIRLLELDEPEALATAPIREDLAARLLFLEEVGLGYLAPARRGDGLSGGELRRSRLAAACAARMSGLLYLLDEPTAGLHPADRPPLAERLRRLVDEGNTVVCVEHDPGMVAASDHLVELGPGAGASGGYVLGEGSTRRVLRAGKTPMATLLAATPPEPSDGSAVADAPRLELRGARRHNLDDVDASFPVGGLTCVTGVSGAGKSTLVLEVLAPAARAVLDRAPFPTHRAAALEGLGAIERLSVARGSAPKHPRAEAGGVLGVLDPLRRLYAATLDARTRGWNPSRFSRHVRGGRCETCKGLGARSIALRELPPVRVSCDVCEGTGFFRDTLTVRVKGLSIAEALQLPIEGAATLFRDVPSIARPLKAAADVGLGYIPVGEATQRLSGGEALRLRLAAALGRGGTGPTLYLLDEPSAGLHPTDVAHLAQVLLRLARAGHTVVAVEHHPDVIRLADHVIELGPGAGPEGGRIVFEGSPRALAREREAATAPFL